MKIKSSKLFALLLAVVLVFGTVAVAASAAEENPYVKVSSIANAEVGAKNQKITVYLSPKTELVNAKLVLKADAKLLDNVSVVGNKDVTGTVDIIESTREKIVINVPNASNTSEEELVLATISFDFQAGVMGAVVFDVETGKVNADKDATIGEKPWADTMVIGEEVSVYKDMVGIGIKTSEKAYATTSNSNAPAVKAKAKLTLVALDGTKYPIEVEIKNAFHGKNVMTKDDFAKFLETNKTSIAQKIQKAMNNTELTYDEFEFDADSLKLNNGEIKAADKYDEKAGEYVYTADMIQCEPTKAFIRVVFRSAMDSGLYHGSAVGDYVIPMNVYAGKTVFSQATLISYMKGHVDLYNQRNGDLDTDNDGTDDLSIDGVMLNQWIMNESAGQYNLGDFVLDESVAAFNNAKIAGTEKYVEDRNPESIDKAKNVYTVYFDQVNVPQSVLMAAADAFGKLDYGQFADANVKLINETIGAFQAFCDSLVNAEWPSAEDVEEDEDKDTSDSPKTGAFIGLGSALAVVAALSATAVAIVRKKED